MQSITSERREGLGMYTLLQVKGGRQGMWTLLQVKGWRDWGCGLTSC